MHNKLELAGIFRMTEDGLIRDDGLHLKAGIRHKLRKGTAKRFIGWLDDKGSFSYISSLYPTKDRNTFSLDWDGIHYVLEMTATDKAEIRIATEQAKKEPEVALFYRGEDD